MTVNPAYPEALRAAERAALDERRRVAGVDGSAPLVGVALSGGGIRSATFALGLFQALARHRLLRRIDFLSTVSGGGYFGAFLGAALSRTDASIDSIERELADDHSWPVRWLREKGRFLSSGGAGDNWLTAAVALRNWFALHTVLLTFAFVFIGLGTAVRADLSIGRHTAEAWRMLEMFFWNHPAFGIWWSPWLVLPVIPLVLLMIPTGTTYWLTQFPLLMAVVRRVSGILAPAVRVMTTDEFIARAQHALTRGFMLGLLTATALLGFAVVDSLGQTYYLRWSLNDFPMPFEGVVESLVGDSNGKEGSLAASLWAALTGVITAIFGVFSKIAPYIGRHAEARGVRTGFNVVALGIVIVWSLLWMLTLSVLACGFAWQWDLVWHNMEFVPMSGGYPLLVAISVCFVASWLFSRAFGFVNLSSMQQAYAARLARAYIGATNPERRRHENHSMSDLVAGDDVRLEDYNPHRAGGPLHLINITVNETLSGRKHIERRDRKGLAMAVGPCALSVGIESHALWETNTALSNSHFVRSSALWEKRQRAISPLPGPSENFLGTPRAESDRASHFELRRGIEALSVGRWAAISGAAFTTGTATQGETGLRLLLGLANVRFGYWWDSGTEPGMRLARSGRPSFIELASRLANRILPVQSSLFSELFAHFHGPARRRWHLSDGGYVENTGCYELIRRRVPFIICCDAGHDAAYEFADFADLVRKARVDFRADIQVATRTAEMRPEEAGVRFPMPRLEELVHPELLDVIGTPEDFTAVGASEPKESGDDAGRTKAGRARAHALLARIHYTDTDAFSWLLLVKPSVMGDEAMDVLLHQRRHALFPQEPTTDQYCDEAQWESYRKLGEHIGMKLFAPPTHPNPGGPGKWSPSDFAPPAIAHPRPPEATIRNLPARASRPDETPGIPDRGADGLGPVQIRTPRPTPPQL